MTLKPTPDTKTRILVAAEELTSEHGPARISLEGIAARAGVSKGGLLYHFPTKHDLLRALVAAHVDNLRLAMRDRATGADCPLDVARAYLSAMREKLSDPAVPPGLFAAIADDPEFIAPLRAFRQSLLADVFFRCPDPDLATVAYFACEGMLHARLTDPQAPTADVRDAVFDRMDALLAPLREPADAP